MSIVDFIAIVSFGLTCFGLRYIFGRDNKPHITSLSANYTVTFVINKYVD